MQFWTVVDCFIYRLLDALVMIYGAVTSEGCSGLPELPAVDVIVPPSRIVARQTSANTGLAVEYEAFFGLQGSYKQSSMDPALGGRAGTGSGVRWAQEVPATSSIIRTTQRS